MGRRLSTETRLIMSTTELIRGKCLPLIIRRSKASAEPRYRAGSFPKALYAARVAEIAGASRIERGSGIFRICDSQAFNSSVSEVEDSMTRTLAVTQPSAARGHLFFN